jgi:hypothetical protein
VEAVTLLLSIKVDSSHKLPLLSRTSNDWGVLGSLNVLTSYVSFILLTTIELNVNSVVVTNEAVSELVTNEAVSEFVTNEAVSELVTNEAVSEFVTNEAVSELVTNEAVSELVTNEAVSELVTNEAVSEFVTNEPVCPLNDPDIPADVKGEPASTLVFKDLIDSETFAIPGKDKLPVIKTEPVN